MEAAVMTIRMDRDEIPNDETLAAMRETEEILAHPERYKLYESAQELFDDILSHNPTHSEIFG